MITCKACKVEYDDRRVCQACQRCRNCGCACHRCATCKDANGQSVVHRRYYPCVVCKGCRISCGCRKIPHNSRELWTPDKIRMMKGIHGVMNPYKRAVSVEVELASWGAMEEWRFENFLFQMHGDSSVSSGKELGGNGRVEI